MKIVAVIPARLKSTRLPNKVLADIGGLSMLQRTYHAVKSTERFDQVIVATDSEEVMMHCIQHGMRAMITSEAHTSGTDRVAEVAQMIDANIIVNVQADEPFIERDTIIALVDLMATESVEIATLCKPITETETLLSYDVVKVVKDLFGKVMYFSRQAIPSVRDLPYRKWLGVQEYFQHLGIYAFRKDTLLVLSDLPPHAYETSEKLEQLRWLAHGKSIHIATVASDSFGIDTEEDLDRARVHVRIS